MSESYSITMTRNTSFQRRVFPGS